MAIRRSSMTHGQADKPAGADAVREAILDAAIRLLEERGTTDVSLREIARAANVNHGLVHRHFGTRNDVLTAVFHRQSQLGATQVTDASDIDEALGRLQAQPATKAYARLLAAALLDGVEPAGIAAGHSFRQLLELLSQRDGDELTRESTAALAAAVCLILGWGVFGEFISASAGLKGRKAQALDKDMAAMLRKLVAPER